jgi:hypothetical protein
MYTPPTNVLTALQGNHMMSMSATCIKYASNGTTTQTTIPIILDSNAVCTAKLSQQIARTAAFSVPRSFLDDGWLNPLTDRVFIRTGVANVGDLPVFTGRPLATVDDNTGKATVQCVDFADDVINDDFSTPWVNTAGDQYSNEFRRILFDVNSTYGVTFTNVPSAIMPALAWEVSRGQALDQIASALSCIWMADRSGSFTLFANPYGVANPVPVFTIRDGVNGALVSVEHTKSRAKIFNSITLLVEQATIPPFAVIGQDLRPNSTTIYGDNTPFGKRNKTYKVNVTSPLNVNDAIKIVKRILSQSLALTETWTIRVPHLPVFDPGDIIAVWYRGSLFIQVIESVSYNLAANQLTVLQTRTLVYNDIATIVGATGQ